MYTLERIILAIASVLFLCSFQGNKLDSLKSSLDESLPDTVQYKTLRSIVFELENIDRTQVTGYGLKLLEVAEKIGDQKKLGSVNRILGRNYLFLAKNDSAMIYLQQSNEHFNLAGDSSGIYANLSNIALIHQRNNDYERATTTYLDVISYSTSTGNYYDAAIAIVNLASVYIDQENYSEAIEQLKEVEVLYQEEDNEGDKKNIYDLFSPVYINLGQCYAELGQLQEALDNYSKALESSQALESPFLATYYGAYANHSIGAMYGDIANDFEPSDPLFTSNWQNARTYYKDALDGFREIENARGEVFSMVSYGEALSILGNTRQADQLLTEGLAKAQEIGFREEIRDAYKNLSLNAKNKNDYRGALEYMDKYITYKDSIRNEERDATIEDVKGRYEAEARDAEIAKLEAEQKSAQRRQLLQLLIFIFSILGILLVSYILYTRYRLRQQVKIASFEKNLSAAMAKFVPTEFINALGKKKITDVHLGDQTEKEVTVIFTDIRNFTSISEELDPRENFRLVKEYCEKMSPIIQRNNGFINQYLGDGIMAIFDGSPDDA